MSKLTLWDRLCGNHWIKPGLMVKYAHPFTRRFRVSVTDWREYSGGMSPEAKDRIARLKRLRQARDH